MLESKLWTWRKTFNAAFRMAVPIASISPFTRRFTAMRPPQLDSLSVTYMNWKSPTLCVLPTIVRVFMYMLMWAHVCALIECAGPSTKYIQSYYNFVILSMNLNIYRYIYGGWYACNIRIHLKIPIKLNIWTLFYVVRSVSTKRLIVGAKKAAKIPLLLTRGTWELLIEWVDVGGNSNFAILLLKMDLDGIAARPLREIRETHKFLLTTETSRKMRQK